MLDFNSLDRLYIIAEIGANHNGSVALAKKMIIEAKECGADAVKFQHFDAKNMITQAHLDELDSGKVKLENVDCFETPELGLKGVREQLTAFSFSKEEMIDVRGYAKKAGIDFGCTTEDKEGVEFLKSISVDFLKISSADCNNLSLLKSAIGSNLPILLSTGMADFSEIDNAYRLFYDNKYRNFALLHCVSIYPPREEIINLNFIDTMKRVFDSEIGYSDHSLGYSIALAAIAKGVKIIEKHFTLDKNTPGWDHKVSADPAELEVICREGKRIFKALGDKYKHISQDEVIKRKKFRKSITTIRDMKRGDILTEDGLLFKRPGTGISPDLLPQIIGRKINKDIRADSTLFFEDLI